LPSEIAASRIAAWRIAASTCDSKKRSAGVTIGAVFALTHDDAPNWLSMRGTMQRLLDLYRRVFGKFAYLQPALLLAVRLYWGWQFAQTGWGKMHNIAKITGFFASLNIPFPGLNAHFISGLEFFGGLLLILGLATRLTGLLLASNMMVAYWTADREALTSIFSDPGKFYVADPYTFLFASLLVLIFGAGMYSLDAFILRRMSRASKSVQQQRVYAAPQIP
jgi:putative oxidoreductase